MNMNIYTIINTDVVAPYRILLSYGDLRCNGAESKQR